MNRRDFLEVLAAAAAAGMPLAARDVLAQPDAGQRLYDVPRFGNVSVLHFTDCHAQLKPVRFREPSVNIGVGDALGKPPHLVGEALLKRFGIRPGTRRGARLHVSRLRAGGAHLRQGRRVRAPGHARQAAQGLASGRAAARRRRHLAGIGNRLVDQRARTWSMPPSCSASTS